MEDSPVRFRYLLAVMCVAECLLLGGLNYGWGSLVFVLKLEGFFLDVCPGNHTVGSLKSPWPLYPGLSLMGAGGLSLYCLDHQVAQLFPKGGLVFVALAAGSLDTSAGMQLLVKLLYEAGVSRRACYIGLAALCLLPLLTTFLLFPKGFVRPVLDTTDNSGQGEEGTGDGQSSKSRPRDKSGHDNASYTKDGEEFSLGSGQQWPVKVYSSGVESLAKSGNEVLSQTSYSDILPKHNETGEGDDKGDKPHAVSACIAKPSGDVTHHTKHSDDVPFPTKPSDDVTPETKSSHDVTHNTGLNGDVAHHTEINGDVTRHTELNDDVTNATSPGTDVTSGLADNVSMRAVFLCPRYLLHMLWCVLGQFAFFAFFSSINMRLEILLDTIQQDQHLLRLPRRGDLRPSPLHLVYTSSHVTD
ncbi:uncharacterized protein LOC101860350 [Aplysia californica]|uniref:Uncharacterized protein LOC101860350 n=1 Tax=Aplysia californica TaxID=6500 RepID=A0ABM0JX98_APLCA|nr:uncharacterized protein LOC101860350 [Aplysia californica]